jgi:hypothetical protein
VSETKRNAVEPAPQAAEVHAAYRKHADRVGRAAYAGAFGREVDAASLRRAEEAGEEAYAEAFDRVMVPPTSGPSWTWDSRAASLRARITQRPPAASPSEVGIPPGDLARSLVEGLVDGQAVTISRGEALALLKLVIDDLTVPF